MRIAIKLDENDIRQILAEYINRKYNTILKKEQLIIQVKSKQNYKSEWETADIRLEQEILPS